MKKIAEKLIGNAEQFSFEQRIFHFSMLLGFVLTFIGALMDIYYKNNPVIDFLFIGFWIMVYYISRFKGYFKLVSSIAFAVLVLAFLPYQWILSGGIMGDFTYYPIIFLSIVCIVLSGRIRISMAFAVLGTVLLLIFHDSLDIGSAAFVLSQTVNLIIVMISMAVLLFVYSSSYKKEKERSDAYAKAVEQNYHQQLYYMETLEGLIDRLKSERHDFNNHLGLMYGLLENGENEKARDYATTLANAAEEYRSIVSLPYSMLRAMLNYKLSAAKEQGIALRLNVGIPGGLALEEADLAVIVGNLLDNAIEACADIEEEKEKYISLSFLYNPDYLIIQVENPVNTARASIGGKGKTSKPDKENHGFGLRNIEYIVNKHRGLMKIEPESGVFRISLALLIES